ncbi:MAG: hypothetical protein GY909_10635 [Oligoflexia bacterium]|nr:hypothetical protein [Oligoflexia bacterium]
MTNRTLVLIFIFNLFSLYLIGKAQARNVNFKYDSGVKRKYVSIIENDLDFLHEFSFSQEPNPETLQVFGLESFQSTDIEKWLSERVNYIIKDRSYESLKLKTLKYFFPYENPNDFPEIESYATPNRSEKEIKEMTIMSNIGTAIYYSGKRSQRLLGLRIKKGLLKYDTVAIRSPRVGILQIGEGLFSKKFLDNPKDEDSRVNSIIRISTLLHEARHSDGSGKNLGFLHIPCPKGHDYEGLKACDFNLNGPYSISSQSLIEFLKSCQDCNEEEKEIIRFRILNNSDRVIKKRKLVTTSTNEKVSMLKNLLFLKLQLNELKLDTQLKEKNLNSIESIRNEIDKLSKEEENSYEHATHLDPKPELNELDE